MRLQKSGNILIFTYNFFSNLKICLYHEIGFLISTPLHRAEIIHVSCKSKLRHEMHIIHRIGSLTSITPER